VAKYAVWAREYHPGTPAPAGGIYEQCNVLGSTTGITIALASGQTLPAAQRGFTWRVVEPPPEPGAGSGEIGRAARSAETE
jgi:hypothetical protein